MKDNRREDNVFVNIISPPNEIEAVSDTPVGKASENPFCIYAGVRHAVGSKIVNKDGREAICTEDGSWQNV